MWPAICFQCGYLFCAMCHTDPGVLDSVRDLWRVGFSSWVWLPHAAQTQPRGGHPAQQQHGILLFQHFRQCKGGWQLDCDVKLHQTGVGFVSLWQGSETTIFSAWLSWKGQESDVVPIQRGKRVLTSQAWRVDSMWLCAASSSGCALCYVSFVCFVFFLMLFWSFLFHYLLTHSVPQSKALVPRGCAHAACETRPSFRELYFCCVGKHIKLKLV